MYRGASPAYLLMDAWNSSTYNLKFMAKKGLYFMTNIRNNRQVSIKEGTYIPVKELDCSDTPVKKVWMKGFGFVLIRKITL